MRARLAAIGSAGILLAGIGSAAAGSYHRYSIPSYGISLALPSSWKAVDYREILKPGMLETLARDNPELAGSFAGMARPNSPIKLFAYDPLIANGFATNVNVLVLPLRARLTFSEYERVLLDELHGISSVSDIRSSVVRLPAGHAVRVAYRLSVTVKRRRIAVVTLQYGFLRGRRSVVFTYTTLPGSAKFYRDVFATSARSIRFS